MNLVLNISNITILSLQQEGNLAIVLFSTKPNNTMEMVTSSCAIDSEIIDVTEVDEDGDVNELAVSNKSEKFVFFMDGDILEGAMQNRVLNSSVLLAPKTNARIPVSCVESDRWAYESENFRPGEYVAPIYLRATKSYGITVNLENDMGHQSNQDEVWKAVEDYSLALKTPSVTSDLSDAFKGTTLTLTSQQSFTYNSKANGVIFFKNNHPYAMDIFNRTDIMEEYYPKLLRGLQFETPQLNDSFETMTDAEASSKTFDFIGLVANLEKQEYPGVAEGIEYRFASEDFSGFELYFQDQLIHKSAMSFTDDDFMKH